MVSSRTNVIYLFSGAIILLTVTGCGATGTNPLRMLGGQPHVETALLSTHNIESPPRPDNCYVDMVLDRSPERPYVVLGRVTTLWTGTDRVGLAATEAVAVPHLRAQACRSGGHVVFQVRSHYQDEWVSRTTTRASNRDLMVRTIRSTALVGVYVERNGRVLAAPTGPRRVIRVPTSVESMPSSLEDEQEEDPLTWDQGLADPWAVPAP